MARQDDIYVAVEAFTAEIDGLQYIVNVGERVRAGHALLRVLPTAFERLVDQPVTYEVEQATAAPSEKRGAPKR